MSRAIPRRRARDRASRTRDPRTAVPAFTETEPDTQPETQPETAADTRAGTETDTRAGTGTGFGTEPEAPDEDLPALTAAAEFSRQVERRPQLRSVGERHRTLFALGWLAVVATGLVLLVLALLEVGPVVLGDVGAVVVLAAYSWALAVRTGGRAVLFGTVALAAGAGVVVAEEPWLRTGAAVMTCGIAATLAVVATVPRTRFVQVVQECVLAVAIAGIGALATLGFSPTISLVRFEYVTLGLALVASFGVVYRLGAGFHGLGRRGLVVVLIGAVVLVVTLLYAELLRRYGTPGLVGDLLDGVRWSRRNLGAFPRPIEAVLGIPALAWGVHMRARRRQGWWVCAFGAAGTVAVTNALLNPAITLREGGLSVLYGLLVGLVLGYLVIRLDLALAGTGSGGRRSDEHASARPEPARTAPLL